MPTNAPARVLDAQTEALVIGVITAQFVLGGLVLLKVLLQSSFGVRSLYDLCCRRRGRGREDPEGSDSDWSASDLTDDVPDAVAYLHDMILHGHVAHRVVNKDESTFVVGEKERKKHHDWQKARHRAFERNDPIFCSHVRTQENFVRGNDDPHLELPPPSPLEVESPYYSRLMLWSYVVMDSGRAVLTICMGWALISGGMASLLCWFHSGTVNTTVGHPVEHMAYAGRHLAKLTSDFKWLPTFLLAGHAAFYLQRWRQFILAAWGFEGCLKNCGMAIGSDVRNPSDPAARALMFRLYRYMVLLMALQYRTVLPALKNLGDELADGLQELGLLTSQEATVLVPAGSRMRDTVLAWIATDVRSNGPDKTGILRCDNHTMLMQNLAKLRGKMMFFHGNNFYPQPNQYAGLMKVMIDTYCMLLVVSYPFEVYVPFHLTWLSLQPIVVACVFMMTACFWGLDNLAFQLASPFSTRVDTFNIDALISGTEQTLFAYLRVGFDNEARGV